MFYLDKTKKEHDDDAETYGHLFDVEDKIKKDCINKKIILSFRYDNSNNDKKIKNLKTK